MRFFIKANTIFLILAISSCRLDTKQPPKEESTAQEEYVWQQTENILALKKDKRIIWQLNFDKTQDKPYFHPLRTPKGHTLTLERPSDHPWHRGLWFSWKDINGTNYWEEDPKKGVAEGRTIIESVNIEKNMDLTAQVTFSISYQQQGETVIRESRKIVIGSPKNNKEYTVKWFLDFEVLKDVRLYLEKPAKHGGVEWGGYAGMSIRASDSLMNPKFTAASGWQNTDDLTGYGEKERWMDITGKVNGSEDFAGLTIYDSPSNPRYPSPYYVWFEKGKHAYFSPSILFDGPMNFKNGEVFSLNYDVLVHDGPRTIEELKKYEEQPK